jgi:hypothetical protein
MDFGKYAEDAIARTALRYPWIDDPDAAWDNFIEGFNRAGEAIEKKFGKRFGLQIERTIRKLRRDGEVVSEPRIVVRPQFGAGWSRAITLLSLAIKRGHPVEYVGEPKPHWLLSRSELAECDRARAWLELGPEQQVAEAKSALAKREGPKPFKAGQGDREFFAPAFLEIMLSFLLAMQIPRREIEYQARDPDGWWRRIGHQRKAGKQSHRKLQRLELQMAVSANRIIRDRNRNAEIIALPGGIVPPGWPLNRGRLLPTPSQPEGKRKGPRRSPELKKLFKFSTPSMRPKEEASGPIMDATFGKTCKDYFEED